MNLSLTIKLSLKNIVGNRLRSGLTILGLVIGIASVILLVGIVNGATKSMNDQLSFLNTDVITVYTYDESFSFQYEDMNAIKRLDYITDATPYATVDASVGRGGVKASNASVYAAGEGCIDVMGYELQSGRRFSRIDINNGTKAAIVGSKIAEKLWKNSDPCGSEIKLNGDNYMVVGVLKSKGSSFGNDADNTVIIPFTSARYLGESTKITEIYVKAESDEVVDEATKSIQSYLSREKSLSSDSCEVSSGKQEQEAMAELNRMMALVLGGIASISLLVGGIGVMNVMLVSVTERTREIGIRKALGARRKDIMYQFLIESMVLSMLGGLIGIITGCLLGRIAAIIPDVYFSPSIGMILLSVGVSVTVGLVFGILPAYRAACLRPVEALRYE